MPKLPYMPFYVSDWTSDPQLAMCSLSTRACWLELLCSMHTLGHGGVVVGTADQIARLCRCSVAELVPSLNELQAYHVGDISERNGKYTVICRRMKREAEAKERSRSRQERFKNAEKTRNKREINAEKNDKKTPDIHIHIQNKERDNARAREDVWQEAEKIRSTFPRVGNIQEDCRAIVDAVQREADKPGGSVDSALELILDSVQKYADSVSKWPLQKRKFIANCKSWFEAGRYNESPEMWDQNDQTTKPRRTDRATPPVFTEEDRDDDINECF